MVPIYQALVPYGPEERRPWAALSFPRDEYERRVAAVQARLSADGLAAVVTFSNRGDPGHARYLANFEAGPGETCVVVPAAGRAMLTTNWLMHGEPMHTMIWTTWLDDVRAADRAGFSKAPAATVAAHIADRLREAGVRRDRVGIAGGALLPHYVMVELEERLPDVAFVPGDDLALGVRAKKSPAEIDVMRRVARISGKMQEAALQTIAPGVTERAVMAAAHAAGFAAGADALAFDTAVASGPRAGLKHAVPTDRVMRDGDLVFIDMGALLQGYCADVSRSAVAGRPTAEAKRFLDAGLAMFEAVLAQAKPGVAVVDLIATARDVAERAGFAADYMPMGFGHGVGCSLFEQPSLRPISTAVLEPGHTFALEPMLIRLNFGTACVEETVLITPAGAEALSGCRYRAW